jgi:hypothetical protein
LPIVHFDAKAGEHSLNLARLGLVLFWVKDNGLVLGRI